MSLGSSWSRPARLVVVLGLNLALVGALVTVGITAHSLGVFAEGGDYLADAAAIGVSTSVHLVLQAAFDPRPAPRLPESDRLGCPCQRRVAPSR